MKWRIVVYTKHYTEKVVLRDVDHYNIQIAPHGYMIECWDTDLEGVPANAMLWLPASTKVMLERISPLDKGH